jgi:hypothetical protein
MLLPLNSCLLARRMLLPLDSRSRRFLERGDSMNPLDSTRRAADEAVLAATATRNLLVRAQRGDPLSGSGQASDSGQASPTGSDVQGPPQPLQALRVRVLDSPARSPTPTPKPAAPASPAGPPPASSLLVRAASQRLASVAEGGLAASPSSPLTPNFGRSCTPALGQPGASQLPRVGSSSRFARVSYSGVGAPSTGPGDTLHRSSLLELPSAPSAPSPGAGFAPLHRQSELGGEVPSPSGAMRRRLTSLSGVAQSPDLAEFRMRPSEPGLPALQPAGEPPPVAAGLVNLSSPPLEDRDKQVGVPCVVGACWGVYLQPTTSSRMPRDAAKTRASNQRYTQSAKGQAYSQSAAYGPPPRPPRTPPCSAQAPAALGASS